MSEITIGIAGYGYVGRAMTRMLQDHYKVFVYDPKYQSQEESQCCTFVRDIEMLNHCSIGIVCVPTPSSPNGSCNLSHIEDVISKLRTEVIVIKSTIPPGTTDRLMKLSGKRIVFSPEYIGEGKYWNPVFNSATGKNDNMKAIPFLILGGNNEDTRYVLDILTPILGPYKNYFQTTCINAEVIKYMENAYIAMKVTFVNEMFEVCNALGADWYAVREGWLLDPRVDKSNTVVFPHARGFSGKCIPKDIAALIHTAHEAGYEPGLLQQIIKSNAQFHLSDKSNLIHGGIDLRKNENTLGHSVLNIMNE